MKTACLTLAITGALLTCAPSALASGSVIPRIGRPPAVDAQYDIGKALYNGTATLGEASASTAPSQLAKLDAWKAKLPASAARAKELPALAGKLNDTQLAALEQFLKTRYGLK